MNRLDTQMRLELAGLLVGRVCIVGVGNRVRGDDAAGPCVIDAQRGAARGLWIDAGVAPENFLEPIARSNPNAVLFVDAVAFAGSPGECRLMAVESLDAVAVSTHAGSLAMLGEYLSGRTAARIKVMAIQPERIDAREGLSDAVDQSVRRLAAMLSDLLAPAGHLRVRENGRQSPAVSRGLSENE